MTNQRHNPYDEAPMDTPHAGEPVAAYQAAAQRPVITEMSKTFAEEEEWLRPMTMDDIHRRIDEAEADIMAGRVAFGIKAAQRFYQRIKHCEALLGRYAEGHVRVSTVATPPL